MPLAFVQKMEATARRIERRRWMTAACWAFTAIVLTMVGLAAVDWLLGVYHLAPRILLTAMLVAALIAIFRWGRGATRERTAPLDVALALERLRPEYRNLLASGLEFSQQEGEDPTAGSLELRRAVVLRASLAADELDMEAIAPRTPLRRAAVAALVALTVLAAPTALAPQSVATGVMRLVNPLSDAEWPRRHDLAFVESPELVPIGGDFETTLRDRRGELPRTVDVEYRTRRGGHWQYETQTYAASGDAVVVCWPNVQGPFEYRARGGDHESMPWKRVETARAPQIDSLSLSVEPPAYTNLPREIVPGPARVIAGSELSISGKTNLPIASGNLVSEDLPEIPLEISVDGHSFVTADAAWRPARSSEWSFKFRTPQGMESVADRRLSIEVVPDRPPTAEIVEPTGELVVLPEAKVELTVRAADDLAVRSISISALKQGAPASEALTREIYRGAETPEPGPRELIHVLEVSALAPAVATAWVVHVHAGDYAGQGSLEGRPLTFRVISRDDFLRRVDAYHARIRTALERALDNQQGGKKVVDSVIAPANPPAVGTVAAALAEQRAVSQAVDGGPESARQLCRVLATELRRNQWPDDSAVARLLRLQDQLAELSATHLTVAEKELTAAARELGRAFGNASAESQAAVQRSLIEVRREQSEAIALLELMLDSLAEASEIHKVQRELSALGDEQAKLLERTQALARQALIDQSPEANVQQQRQRDEALAQQRELAGRIAAAVGGLRDSATKLAVSKPTEAARLEAVAAEAERLQLQSTVRRASDELAAGRLAQAVSAQRQTTGMLDELTKRMAESGEGSVEQRAAKLAELQGQLDAIRREVAELAAEQRKPEGSQGGEQNRELANRAEELADDLEDASASPAAASTRRAAEQLEQQENAAQGAAAAQHSLEQAKAQLAAEQHRQETLLSKLKVEQLDAALGRLAAEQQAIVEETLSLESLRDSQGKLGAEQEDDLTSLARQQTAIHEQTLPQEDRAKPFPVFARMLRTAADTMERAAQRLGDGDTGDETLRLETESLDLLRQLAAAVRQQRDQQSPPPASDPQQQTPPGSEQQPSDPDQVQRLHLAVAQLGLLRSMQADLKEKTVALEQAHAGGEIDAPALRERSEQLAAEQRELSELAATLLQEAAMVDAEGRTPQE